MYIMLTSTALDHLREVLERERTHNPNTVFRIWETTLGRYNDAKICLRLSLDEKGEDDELYNSSNLPFVVSRDFLSLRGEPYIFYIWIGDKGLPEIQEFGS